MNKSKNDNLYMKNNLNVEIGKRISYYRKQMNLTQAEFAEKLNLRITISTVSKWENGLQPLLPEQVVTLANFFGIDAHMLLTGQDRANQNLSSDLGLSDLSISYLHYINENRLSTELNIINLMLSTETGNELLQLIGQYCFADFKRGFIKDTENFDRDGNPKEIPCEEISFRTNSKTSLSVSLDLVKYSLVRGIEKCIDDLRENKTEEF